MRPPFAFEKAVCRLFGPLCLAFCGCLGAFAIPSIEYVPGKDLGDASDQIHVFRIDVTDKLEIAKLNFDSEYRVQEISREEEYRTSPQFQTAMNYGWCALIRDKSVLHYLLVRMYRPGFQTIEINPWPHNQSFKWVPAVDLKEQEIAIDDLVSRGFKDKDPVDDQGAKIARKPLNDGETLFDHLVGGGTSGPHQAALRFAAGEYERLADLAPNADEEITVRSRLLDKAGLLRHRASSP
jgi:hypothetical protein